MVVVLTIAYSGELRTIVHPKNTTFDVLKVSEASGRIDPQPTIKDNQPGEDTEEQHGLFYT